MNMEQLYLDLENVQDLQLDIGCNAPVLVSVKYNTTANWNAQLRYVPAKGELVIYSDHISFEKDGVTVYQPGLKIGDGNAYLIDLPFVGETDVTDILNALDEHIHNTDIHVTPEQKTFWNNKLNYQADEQTETLVLNRN